jgi:hypothetical protein
MTCRNAKGSHPPANGNTACPATKGRHPPAHGGYGMSRTKSSHPPAHTGTRHVWRQKAVIRTRAGNHGGAGGSSKGSTVGDVAGKG